jgi:hypothetical protein
MTSCQRGLARRRCLPSWPRTNRRAALVLDSSEALLGGLVRVGELPAERLVSEPASGEAEILVPSSEAASGELENWPSPKAWL